MSSLVAAPSQPSGGAAQRRLTATGRRLAAHPDAVATIAVATLLAAVAFVARGGAALPRTTAVEIGLTLLGGGAVAVAVLAGPRGRVRGGATLALFGALAALTALSVAWSVQPDASWQAADLTLAYLATFAGGIALVRIAGRRWAGVLGGVVLAAIVVCGFSLLAKVFPSISPLDLYARLRAPFEYWNAVGLMAALGIPGCLWLGARRDGHAALGALAVPALGLLLVALLLSEGRGPLLAALVAGAAWFAVAPLRLRAAAVLATAGGGAAAVCAWAFSKSAITTDGTPLAARAQAGHSLGLLLLVMLVVLLLAGLALAFAMARTSLAPPARRQLGAVVLAAVALVPLAGVAGLAASQRGLTGSVSHAWHQLTDPNAQQPGNDPSRLTSVGGVRARYWDNAITIWKQARLTGVGADGYATARRRIQPDRLRVQHAHGYLPQTLADLGLLGIGVSLALLAAWLVAAGRATGVRPRHRWGAWLLAMARARSARVQPVHRPPTPETAERTGLMTLAATALAFGVHSTVDWTWFVPGTAVAGLLCAAWVAGRGPVSDPPGSAAWPRGRAAWLRAPRRAGTALLVAIAALAGAWAIWQPQRAADANDAALAALDANRLPQAQAQAQDAHRIDPLSLDPLLTLAAAQSAAGQATVARATLAAAVRLQPANPESWLRLGQLELQQGDARAAVKTLDAAVYLDPQNPATQSAYAQAAQAAGTGASG